MHRDSCAVVIDVISHDADRNIIFEPWYNSSIIHAGASFRCGFIGSKPAHLEIHARRDIIMYGWTGSWYCLEKDINEYVMYWDSSNPREDVEAGGVLIVKSSMIIECQSCQKQNVSDISGATYKMGLVFRNTISRIRIDISNDRLWMRRGGGG